MKRTLSRKEMAVAKRAITEAARREGITEEEFRAEMTDALMEGYNNPDPNIQAVWKTVPCAGDVPTPEEVIIWASARLTAN